MAIIDRMCTHESCFQRKPLTLLFSLGKLGVSILTLLIVTVHIILVAV